MTTGLSRAGFDIDARFGEEGESVVRDIIDGLVEVKRDAHALETGRLYVETECRGRPSGLSITESAYWAFVLTSGVVVFVPTDRLKSLIAGQPLVKGGDFNRSLGVLLPLLWLLRP